MWTLALASLALAEEPAPAAAPGATPATPVLESIRGIWWFTSQVDGAEAVGWACKGTPSSITFDGDTFVLSTGAEPLGAAVRGQVPKGETLALTTTIEACGTKEMTLRWADAAHQILEIGRCDTGAKVRAVRNVASGVPVMRQCCDPAGKSTGWVPTETPCRSGDGQKPTPLRR
jgi:hypothetical protein